MAVDKGKVVHNQPYDETFEISDGEEIASNNPTPRMDHNQQHLGQQAMYGGSGEGKPADSDKMIYEEDEDDDSREEGESEEEEVDAITPGRPNIVGGYDPTEYDHLQVSTEIKELFQYITRYVPQTINIECRLNPFIPDYVPAIGDIDAFLKVTRPDAKTDPLGLTVLDEPATKQSDPHVLDLQLRTHAKQTLEKPAPVHCIQNPEANTKALDSWIENIKELHRQKPATNVHYTRNMPDIETLMQEWPPEFEDILKEVGLPTADLDCDLKDYVDILCSLLDIPVRGNRIHSLHVLFSLFMEFKNSQHFNPLNTNDIIDT